MNISVSLGICGAGCMFLFFLAPPEFSPGYFRYFIGVVGLIAGAASCFLIGKEFLEMIISTTESK